MRAIDMPPDAAALMESTRAIGYSLPTAVADIIDNSIAANATRVAIFYLPSEEYIAFLDDGEGMTANELNVAMKYGGRSPLDTRNDKDLGRFDLGLKTASLSQCEVLTVVSKKCDRISARRWDLNFVRSKNSWSLLELNPIEIDQLPLIKHLKALEHGTLVVWQQLDRMVQGGDLQRQMTEQMDKVRRHIALVFHRYLSGEEGLKPLSITMNAAPVEPSDPFLRHRQTQREQESSFERIKIVPYMLPHPSHLKKSDHELLGLTDDLQKYQGFYIYRNRRLIVWGNWFRRSKKETLSSLARIQIDIPTEFDSLWVLDVKKSSATPPKIVLENLDRVIERLSSTSRKTWEHRGRRETSDKIQHVWNRLKARDGSILYEINGDHPMVKRLIDQAPGLERELNKLLEVIASSLPLNQMTIDLNGSNEIGNAASMSEDDVRQMLEMMVNGLPTDKLSAALETLKNVEPFSAFPDMLDNFKPN